MAKLSAMIFPLIPSYLVSLMKYQSFIAGVLKQASAIALRYFGSVTGITTKSGDNNQVLTEADMAIGASIVASIRSEYPGCNIIDEEAGIIDNDSAFTWVIDPIDGTSNFAAGVPTYGVIVGLLDGGFPIAGGIVYPSFQQMLLAERGQGAFCNGDKITVSAETDLLSSLVAYTIDGHQENPAFTKDECGVLGEIVLGIRNLRSSGSVFDGAMVARGKYGVYLNRTSKIWDNVGLHVIIEEAGGVYTDFFGCPMDYTKPIARASQNYTFCMGAPALHAQVQRIIHHASNL